VDPGIQRRIVDEVRVPDGGGVVEIGPGKGALTGHLVERARSEGFPLVLVELDRALAWHHAERWGGDGAVRVVEGDILDHPMASLVDDPARTAVVGNIPYNITTPIVFHLLERPRPASILLMVQREVGDRILAEPGSRDYGALSVGVRTVASVERVLPVPAGAFRPRPRVESMVIRITPFRPEPLEASEEAALRRLVRALFQWRRKQLGRTLRDHPELRIAREVAEAAAAQVGITLDLRPEVLAQETLVALSRALPLR
jgi:16S rRNA (adenine1518-N6/adenine1519-N6)-dimethyltransferase